MSHATLDQIDQHIIRLLRQRCAAALTLPDYDGRDGPVYPKSFRADEVRAEYRHALGAPGDLIALAILNLSRAADSLPTGSQPALWTGFRP